MNAQDMFKVHYRKAMAYRKAGYPSAARVAVAKAEEYLREAALERALEAERRENKKLGELVDRLRMDLSDYSTP